jgi:hypothetical protein
MQIIIIHPSSSQHVSAVYGHHQIYSISLKLLHCIDVKILTYRLVVIVFVVVVIVFVVVVIVFVVVVIVFIVCSVSFNFCVVLLAVFCLSVVCYSV